MFMNHVAMDDGHGAIRRLQANIYLTTKMSVLQKNQNGTVTKLCL